MTRFTPSALFELTFIDVSQFVAEPLRTGVQRVLFKVIEFLPRERIMPFRVVDEERVAILDPAIFDFGIRYLRQDVPTQRSMTGQAHGRAQIVSEEDLLIKLVGAHPLAVVKADRFFAHAERIINLEAFSRAARSLFYASCPPEHRGKVFHFIHDLLVFEAPHVFPQLNWRYASDYVLLFQAYCAAGGFFVATPGLARKVARYFNRPLDDVQVVHFGGDLAPPPAAQHGEPSRHRRSVVVLGTIEPRKYPRTVVDALFRVAAYHRDVDCTLIGKFGWVDSETRVAIEQILAAGQIKHLAHLADEDVARIVAAADVGIYVSSNEGFGLPVIEFAARGVPVVTNDAVPAAMLVGDQYATILHTVDVKELVIAVERHLSQPRPKVPYYNWTWADCAREIFDGHRARRGPGSGLDAQSCWQCCTHMVRDLRQCDGELDTIRQQIGHQMGAQSRLRHSIAGAENVPISAPHMAALVEAMSDIVYDNLQLVYWADLVQSQRKLAELARALLAENHLDGLSRAFMAFVGRPIDARAAAEAVCMVRPGALLNRVVDLVNSTEASSYLGAQSATALRRVIGGVHEIVAMCLGEHVDLFALSERLGIPPPTLQDVILTEDLLRSDVDRLELLLYLTHARGVIGDELDLFLEVVAGVCRERGLRIAAPESFASVVALEGLGLAAEEVTLAPPPPALVAGRLNGVRQTEMLPRSFMRDVPLLSASFGTGWHAAEQGGSRMFRWMMREGIVFNPDGARPVRDLILDVQGVYGGHEPLLIGWLGDTPANVQVDEKPDGDGWSVRLTSDHEGVLAPTVRLRALASGCPAIAEGAEDGRELSICVANATFVYKD